MFAARSLPVTVRPLEPGHRHGPSRRQFLAVGAGLGAAGVLGTQVIGAGPALAARRAGDPRPIPGGTQFLAPDNNEVFHVFAPGEGEPNSITDFNGFVGGVHILGEGNGTGFDTPLAFQTDMGFMQGEFIGEDGEHHNRTFVFI